MLTAPWLLVMPKGASGVPPASGAGPVTPVLISSFTTNANPAGVGGDSGNAFQVYLPNKTGAGDLLGLAVSYPAGNSVTSISDNVNGTWSTTPAKSVSDGTTLAVFLFPNSAASSSQPVITFTMNAAGQPVKLRFFHWMNIATVSPLNGTAGQANQTNTGSGVNAGSLTPGANALGNLILFFCDCDGNAGANPTSFSAGGGFTLHDADIGWVSAQGYPAASAYFYQSTPATITPTMTPAGDTTNAYNCVAIALKVASAGVVPAACRVVKVIEHSCNNTPTGAWKLQFPTVGNCRAATAAVTFGAGSESISSLTDSESNTWSNQTPSNDANQAFLLQNAAANPNLVIDVNLSTTPGGTFLLTYDIIGAAATGQPVQVQSKGLTLTSGTSIADQPDITPNALNNIVITCLNNLLGPTTAITSPSGAFWDGVNYTGKSDASQMDWGNGWGHYYVTSLAAESWTWTIANNGEEVAGFSMEIAHG